jgi:hypothetical protein
MDTSRIDSAFVAPATSCDIAIIPNALAAATSTLIVVIYCLHSFVRPEERETAPVSSELRIEISKRIELKKSDRPSFQPAEDRGVLLRW